MRFLAVRVTGLRFTWPTRISKLQDFWLQTPYQTDDKTCCRPVSPPEEVYAALTPRCRHRHHGPTRRRLHLTSPLAPQVPLEPCRVTAASLEHPEGGGTKQRRQKDGVTLVLARRPSILE